jgi:hypothetical protein
MILVPVSSIWSCVKLMPSAVRHPSDMACPGGAGPTAVKFPPPHLAISRVPQPAGTEHVRWSSIPNADSAAS